MPKKPSCRRREADAVLEQMQRGSILQAIFEPTGIVFVIDGKRLRPATARMVLSHPNIKASADAMFGALPQTFRYR